MFVSIYYKPSLFNAHTMILIVHIFMNANKVCLNQVYEQTMEIWVDSFFILHAANISTLWSKGKDWNETI